MSTVYVGAFAAEPQTTTADGAKDICVTSSLLSIGFVLAAIFEGLVVIIGNLLVLIVLYRFPPRRFAALNWLLCHLATADIFIGVITLWWFGVSEILVIPLHLNQLLALNSISTVAILASFEGLAMIALDRYLLILHPLRYPSIVTKKRLLIALVIMWLVPIIIHLVIPLSGWSCVDSCDCRIYNRRPDLNVCSDEKCSQVHPPVTRHQLLLSSVMAIAIFCVSVGLYVTMFYGIRKSSKQMQAMLNKEDGAGSGKPTENSKTASQAVNANDRPCPQGEPNLVGEQPTVHLPRVSRGRLGTALAFRKEQAKTKSLGTVSQAVDRTESYAIRRISTRRQRTKERFRKRDVAVMKSMFIVMSVFSITTLPLLLFLLYEYDHNQATLRPPFFYLLQLTILNSLVNPILYFWRLPSMRRGLIKLLHLQNCHRSCNEESDDRLRSSTSQSSTKE